MVVNRFKHVFLIKLKGINLKITGVWLLITLLSAAFQETEKTIMKYLNNQNFDHKTNPKVGVLLVNLGTPEAPTAAALKPYLREFLSDTRVVEIPKAVWFFILNGIIVPFRSKKSAEAYKSVWTEQGSPLLINTQNISKKVAAELEAKNIAVEFAMRYGSPSVDDKISKLMEQGVEKLLVLPLYPQYSATTTASTFDSIAASFRKRRWFPELRFVNQYHDNKLYVEALATKVKKHWDEYGQADKLILSFHGIPKRNWTLGDPYACQCHKTSRLLREKLGLAKDQVLTCFQSRFGKQEWLKPYTDATLKSLPEQGVKSVQVIAPGFSADCLETLEEIDEENKEYFMEAGGEKYQYIPCLNDDSEHIGALLDVIDKNIQGWSEFRSDEETELEFQNYKQAQSK